jgi:hypothetical protein
MGPNRPEHELQGVSCRLGTSVSSQKLAMFETRAPRMNGYQALNDVKNKDKLLDLTSSLECAEGI